MKYTLIVMILAISFTSVARGVDQTNPTAREVKLDWVKHPGETLVLAGSADWLDLKDDIQVVNQSDFSDFDTSASNLWSQVGANTSSEIMDSIGDSFDDIKARPGLIGTNTIVCSFKVADGTKFTGKYVFNTVEKYTVTHRSPYREDRRIKYHMSKSAGTYPQDSIYEFKASVDSSTISSKNATTYFKLNWAVGANVGGKEIYTGTPVGDQMSKSISMDAGFTLSAGAEKKVEESTGEKFEQTSKLNFNQEIPVSLPKGKYLAVYAFLDGNRYNTLVTEYTDSDNDGFPEKDSTIQYNVSQDIPTGNGGIEIKITDTPPVTTE